MINKAIIVGNLGADPEVKNTQSGSQVATFNVATTERWKDQSGQQQESTEWHKIVTWDKLAEVCGEYLKKGSRVYIEGKIQTRKWEKDGRINYTTEIVAREMKMLDTRNRTGAETDYDDSVATEGGGMGEVPF